MTGKGKGKGTTRGQKVTKSNKKGKKQRKKANITVCLLH